MTCEHVFVTAQGSPLTKLRRALAGGDLAAARVAAGDLPHVGLDEAAALLALIASSDPERLEPASVRFLGRVCVERAPALEDARMLAACLAQLQDESPAFRQVFAVTLQRVGVRLEPRPRNRL
jgi:hypothetical protein